jgi:hypothetical protein
VRAHALTLGLAAEQDHGYLSIHTSLGWSYSSMVSVRRATTTTSNPFVRPESGRGWQPVAAAGAEEDGV